MILVVDDSSEWAKVLTQTVKLAGYTCNSVETGRQAIQALIRDNYELAIIDFNLPDINGVEVAITARRAGVKIPFFLISGAPSDATEAEMAEAKFEQEILKPIIPRDFISLINHYTGRAGDLPPNTDTSSFEKDV